ncbi:MAG: TonB-dependent receptor plug domain-containing protein, partial [Gammaproteobacteria bacterium]
MTISLKAGRGRSCLLVTLAAIWALPALGQQNALEEVIVTGSLIARPADRPQPVTVLGAEDLANEQRANLGEIFMDMSISQGGSALNSGPTSPTSYVNLRGVGARATLVLLDGRRQTVDGAIAGGSAAVDINNLAPSIMLERVEVLTDGASALYGSDAVAGVVNLITRRNFEGAEISVRGMELDRTGTGESMIGAIFGTSVADNTSIVAGFEYTERDLVNTDMLFDDDRLKISVVSSSGNPGSFTPVGKSSMSRFADPLCGDASLGRGQADSALAAGIKRSMGRGGSGGYCGLQLSLGRNQVAETERLVGLVVIDHAFGDGLEAKIDMGFARTRFET